MQDNVFVTMVVSVQYQAMPSSLYDAFYRVSACTRQPPYSGWPADTASQCCTKVFTL